MIFDDWVIKPSIDPSDVEKGIRDLKSKFQKIKDAGSKYKGIKGGSVARDKVERLRESTLKAATKAKLPKSTESTKPRALSVEGRVGLETKIERTKQRAVELSSRLKERTDTRSLEVTQSLSKEITKLNDLQKTLAETTDKNSKKYKELYRNIAESSLNTYKLGRETASLSKSAPKQASDKPLTHEAKVGFQEKITRTKQRALDASTRLKDQTDPSSLKILGSLNKELAQLDKLQSSLSEITTKNSQKYREFYSSLSEASLNTARLSKETTQLKRVSSGAGGGPTPLSTEARVGIGARIERTRQRAAESAVKLEGQADPESIRTVEALNAQIAKLDRLQRTLAGITDKNSQQYKELYQDLSEAALNTSRLSRETTHLTKKLGLSDQIARKFSNSLNNLASSYLSIFAAISGISSLVSAGKDLEDTSSVMLLAAGNASLAAEEMKFMKQLSDDVKIRVSDLTRSYAKFAVAGRAAGLSTEELRRQFTDLSISIRATNLSQDKANLAFLGFQQMLAGPTIQAEEMNQVNERMPQFTEMAIRALRELGYEGENYKKIIESGTVSSKDFLSVVSRLMREQAINTGAYEKSLTTVTAASADFRNTLDEMSDRLFKAGLSDTLITLLGGLGNIVQAITPFLEGLVAVINVLFSVISGGFGALGRLLELLGVNEGEGVVWVVRFLAGMIGTFLIPMMIKWHLKNLTVISSLFGMTGGVLTLSRALIALKTAWRSLLFSTGIGALVAVAGFAAEKLFLSSTAEEEGTTLKTLPGTGGTSNVINTTNQVSQTFNTSAQMDEMQLARFANSNLAAELAS